MTTLDYVPHLRDGALLFSLLAFRHLTRCGGSYEQVPIDIYGTGGGNRRNLFGENVHSVSHRAFGSSVSPKQILRAHTFFGVYSRALSPVAADAWANAIVERCSPHQAKAFLRVGPSFNFATQDLRSCSQCVVDDVDLFGFGQWHILHHVPALHYCPKHGCALTTEARGVGSGNRWRYALPLGLPPPPITPPPYAASNGHSAYLDRWTQLLGGKLPVIAGRAWAEYMDVVVSTIGDLASASTEIEAAIEREWSSDINSIRANLGTHIKDDFVHSELSNNPAPARIAQKLIVLGAASALAIAPKSDDHPYQLPLLGSGGDHTLDLPLIERLRRFLRDSALPGALAPFLLKGLSTTEIARSADVHRRCIWRTMKVIPDQLLDEIATEREWSDQSWVEVERRRRAERR